MAIQTINLGTYANDGTGDDLRTAFQKVNANLTELYGALFGANIGASPPSSGVEEGELWWSTITGKLYIRYNSAWIEASPSNIPPSYNIEAGVVSGGANLILSNSELDTDTVKFASSTNITVTRTDANTITFSSDNYQGNASTASAWATPRVLTLTGDVSGSAEIDGSQNVSINVDVLSGGAVELGGDLDLGTFLEPLDFTLDAGTF